MDGGTGTTVADQQPRSPPPNQLYVKNDLHDHLHHHSITTTMESRMTELFVLAGGGTKPFWNTSTPNSIRSEHRRDSHDTTGVTSTSRMAISHRQLVRIVLYLWMISVSCTVLLFPAYRSTDFDVHRHWKALTFRPSTESRHSNSSRSSSHHHHHDNTNSHTIPMIHWYANNSVIPVTAPTTTNSTTKTARRNNKSVETVHTLDYPPGFALLEYIMVNNVIVHRLFRHGHRNYYNHNHSHTTVVRNQDHWDRCWDIMDDRTIYAPVNTNHRNDNDNKSKSPTEVVITKKCISYMRSTVIVFADTIYWCGAGVISAAVGVVALVPASRSHLPPPSSIRAGTMPLPTIPIDTTFSTAAFLVVFVVLTFHPTLLWLDHVHFQYNGTMLGLLLMSIGLLLHGNNMNFIKNNYRNQHWLYHEHTCHIFAIVLFGLLLTLKHLYITNSLWFILYTVRRYCITTTSHQRRSFTTNPTANSIHDDNHHSQETRTTALRVHWLRLCLVAISGSIVIVVPFVPFLVAIYHDETTTLLGNGSTSTGTATTIYVEKVQAWLMQLVQRLFPFQRGLVHTYWAGNVWAMYVAFYKISVYIVRTVKSVPYLATILGSIPSPDTITPNLSALGMLLAQLPGLYMAWSAAVHKCNDRLLQSFTIVSLGTFLFQYHAHEKAIVTSLLPCIVWYAVIRYGNGSKDENSKDHLAQSFDKIQTAGSIMYDMNAFSILGLYPLLYQSQELILKVSGTILYLSLLWIWCRSYRGTKTLQGPKTLLPIPWTNGLTVTTVLLTIVQLEIPYRWLWGRYEFMPLAITSVVCAFGYTAIYLRLIYFYC